MDSWRGMWLSEELNCNTSIVDGNEKCGKSKAYFNGGENYPPLVSNTQALERLDLMDLGFSDDIRKSSYSMSSEPSGEVFSDEIGTDSYGNVVGSSSPFCQDKESGSRILSTNNNNNQEFSLIDLKLGRLGDNNNGGANINGEFSKASGVSAAPSSTVPAKRARSTTLYPQAPCCQVFGCNKDLSCYKGYYKRHKVCDVHTKTAKVVVDGIEQRFCQQCSRFHLVAEFDDGKRSCRRRLAAHNKRRRKPQLNSESGARIIGFSSSFGFTETLPSVTVGSGKYTKTQVQNLDMHVNIEIHSKLKFLPSHYGTEGLADLPAGLEDINVAMATPITQKVSTVQQNSRALSLLSAQSPNVSSELLGAAITNPLINKSGHADSSHHSANVFRKSAQSGFHTPFIYSVEADHVERTTFDPRDGNTVDRKLPGDGISRGPDVRDNSTNYHNPLGRGIILDLLQLSSHLQRVEQQRHSTESEAG